ncbi:putative E3 ubiquitin-protein ligase LIN-2 isoform X2 [Tasmannia lanceolata]|uniref:putative E3 ubiquitin-protein ligase LIN-2 isoform X2 n=1 Tax=Tasmannia lanceolata TaxID=3420 RepID=UPI0040636C10
MASLEELLAEEGFKGRPRSRTSFKSVSLPLYLFPENNPYASASDVRKKIERTRSNVKLHGSGIELKKNERVRVGRSKNNDLLEDKRPVNESKKDKEFEFFEGKGFSEIHEDEKFTVETPENVRDAARHKERYWSDIHENEIFDDQDSIDLHENERFNGNVLRLSEALKDRRGNDMKEDMRYKERTRKELQGNERSRNRSMFQKKMSFNSYSQKNFLESKPSNGGSSKSLQNVKTFEDSNSQMHPNLERAVSEPALDEAAIQAMVSILSGYIRRFLKDKNFRMSIRSNCLSCLNLAEPKDRHLDDSGVVVKLKQAIQTVERVAGELGSLKELKKASLQLSVIAGFNSKDLKDGFTSGIPNSHLAACAHLYLSVIYKLHKKERVSAKHLLQVFCDSPFQARTCLLPELWDHLFLPHLSHLRVWYDQEAEAIPNTSSRVRKLKLLEKVYNEILDSGTYQFAVYYKEWLTEGIEAPAIPSIHIPTTSVRRVSPGGSHGPSPDHDSSAIGSISSHPMISKKLYEAVFGQSNKLDDIDELNNGEVEQNFSAYSRSFDVNIEEKEGMLIHSPKPGTYTGQQMQDYPIESMPEDPSLHADGLLLNPENARGSHPVVSPEVKELDEGDNAHLCQSISGSSTTLHLLSHTTANELTLKKLAKSVFQLERTEGSIDPVDSVPPFYSKYMAVSDLYTKPSNMISSSKCEVVASTTGNIDSPVTISSAGLYGKFEYFGESSSFSTIPKDFTCPLTGQLFEDPVTLETGQTFERVAIMAWFDRGNGTCPVTGQTLKYVSVPTTNFVLKRVIDGWKSEHCRNLLDFATQITGSSFKHEYRSKDEAALFILEKLLTAFSTEERMENAKHLVSLGGLEFLVRRFELGDLEEKTRVASLLSCCIEADGGCRNYIARNIKKSCIVQLLHNKQVRSRTNAVLLLTELICLKRRTTITSFLGDLQKEGMMNTLHVLLVYLQSSLPEQKPLVAVLLLHFDLLEEPQRFSLYREEAVDAITVALDCSLTDEKVREQSCRALFILGGHFSSSGEVLIETWLLNQAGFSDGCDTNFLDNDDRVIQIDESMPWEEDKAREEWLKNLALLLLGNGTKSFLETISKCLSSGNPDLARACLTTVAWLSQALTSLVDSEFQLSAFSILVPRLKESLECEQIQLRVLASMSLLNFSKISECRLLLLTFGEEIVIPLSTLTEVTWTAKELLNFISGECI